MDREKWIVGDKGGPAGPFYSVVDQYGRVIAMQILERDKAMLIAQIPELIEVRYEWSGIINRLARIALDGAKNENERDFCRDQIVMVCPFLGGAVTDAECEFYDDDED